MIALFASTFLLVVLKRRSFSRYNDVEKRAEVSEMRLSYERQIAELSNKLTATEQRWNDANHLLVSSQKAQRKTSNTPRSFYSNFLRSMGLSEKDIKVDPRLVFVLMPFDEQRRSTYETIMKVCSRLDLVCLRGDEQNAVGDILTHVVSSMIKARAVIADVTGRNPNVFYELGLAHAFDKPTVLISEAADDAPFNIRQNRILFYHSKEELETGLLTMLAREFVGNRSERTP